MRINQTRLHGCPRPPSDRVPRAARPLQRSPHGEGRCRQQPPETPRGRCPPAVTTRSATSPAPATRSLRHPPPSRRPPRHLALAPGAWASAASLRQTRRWPPLKAGHPMQGGLFRAPLGDGQGRVAASSTPPRFPSTEASFLPDRRHHSPLAEAGLGAGGHAALRALAGALGRRRWGSSIW